MAFYEDDICDLDGTKICDNCEKCLHIGEEDYMEIQIDGVIKDDEELFLEYEDFELYSDENTTEEEFPYEFIEDNEELREEYNKTIEDILSGKKDT